MAPAQVREILHGPRLQPKLTVGAPDDAFEREADQVAESVMRMPEPAAGGEGAAGPPVPPVAPSARPAIQRLCSECDEEMRRQPVEEPEEGPDQALQTKAKLGQAPRITSDLEPRLAALRGGGAPLPAAERAFFEPRFGRDFGDVRVHTGGEAMDLARRVEARAFTLGRSVVFGAGQYAPGTAPGRALLAHELTHVVQQRGAVRGAVSDNERRAALQRQPEPAPPGPARPAATQAPAGPPSKLPLCPPVGTGPSKEELQQAACSGKFVPAPGTPPDCALRPEQEGFVRAARDQAVERVRAVTHLIKDCPGGRDFAAGKARTWFESNPPSIQQVEKLLDQILPLLSGSNKDAFAGRTCADEECRKSATAAYVKAPGELPIFLCPGVFRTPGELYQTVLHEAVHWAGIHAKRGEAYCIGKMSCDSACGSSDLADAWMHYLSCLGEATLRNPRCEVGKVPHGPRLQPKLAVDAPNGAFEHVMRLPEPAASGRAERPSETGTPASAPAAPSFPTATLARFVTHGEVRCCKDRGKGQCPPHLGPAVPGDPQPQNGMNLVFTISGHRPGILYRFVQIITFQRCGRWAPAVGGGWEVLEHGGPGQRDSPVRDATCPVPNTAGEITMTDAPGLVVRLGGSGIGMIDELTQRLNATNWVIAREGRGRWRRISERFHWFSTTWVRRNAAGVMELVPGANRIGKGSTEMGGCPPPP